MSSKLPDSGTRPPPSGTVTGAPQRTTPRQMTRSAPGSRPACAAAARTTSMPSRIRDRSARLEVIHPSASLPTRCSARGTVPPSSTGGPGRCTGSGAARPAGTV